ncbi:DUF6086 family protein [Streptomyces sp. NPDC054956]
MSQHYDVGDETVWNPSNGAARLFHRQVALFEADLDLPSGIGPLENDECQIDPAVLGPFTEALLARYGGTGHAIVQALSDGFIATVLVLAERTGARVHWPLPLPLTGSLEGRRDVQVPLTGPSVGPSGPAPGSYEASRAAELRAAARELSGRMPR